MNGTFIGIIILFAAYAVNRFVMTEAAKKLDDSMKLKIFEVFSKRNNYATIFVLAVIVLYFGALQFIPDKIILFSAIYSIVIVAYLLFRFVSNYRKLKQMEMPAGYIKSFIISYSVFLLGFIGMGVSMFWGWGN